MDWKECRTEGRFRGWRPPARSPRPRNQAAAAETPRNRTRRQAPHNRRTRIRAAAVARRQALTATRILYIFSGAFPWFDFHAKNLHSSLNMRYTRRSPVGWAVFKLASSLNPRRSASFLEDLLDFSTSPVMRRTPNCSNGYENTIQMNSRVTA